MMHNYAEGEALQAKAIKEIQSKGVHASTTGRRRSSIRYRKTWHEVVEEQKAKSPEFAKAWASLLGVPRGIQDLARARLPEIAAVDASAPREGGALASRLTGNNERQRRRMGLLLGVSNGIKKLLEVVAFASGWLLIVLMCITGTDVLGRKLGIPIPLTKFQELEWYMHTTLFSMWMGYNYVINAHPRVDSYTETLRFRTQSGSSSGGCSAIGAALLLSAGLSRVGLFSGPPTGRASVPRTRRLLTAGSSRAYSMAAWLVLVAVVSVMLR